MTSPSPTASAAAPLSTILMTALAPAAWGTTYLVTTELLPPGRPILAAVLRVLPIGIVLTTWSRSLPTGSWWWRSAVLGLLNIGMFQVLLFVAAHRLPGGVAATAGAIQPLVVAALAAWLLGEPLRRRTSWAGVGGVVGVGLLVLTPQAVLDPVGVVAALAGTVSSAVGVVLTKRWGRPVGLLAATGWQLVAGGLAILPLSLIIEGPPPAIDARGWVGVAWLAVVGTGVAYALWFRGIERLPVSQLSFLALISPLVATAIGWAVLGQSLSVGQLAGAALIATTVVATQRASSRRPTPALAAPLAGRPAGHPLGAAAQGGRLGQRSGAARRRHRRRVRPSAGDGWPADRAAAGAGAAGRAGRRPAGGRLMETHVAAQLVPGPLPAVRKAVAVLAAQLWGDHSRTLLDEVGERIDAIASNAGDDEADVWVTWRFTARPGGTWVELHVDELDTGPEPPDLTTVLAAITDRVAMARDAAGRPG